MTHKSSIVSSNQSGVHIDLESSVKKHLSYPYRKPYRQFSEELFHQINEIQKWHKKFIIFPRRIGNNEMQFLTFVGRRLKNTFDPIFNVTYLGNYEYKDLQQTITDKLMGKE